MHGISVSEKYRGIKSDGIIYYALDKYRGLPSGSTDCATVCKMVLSMLSVRCVSCLSVCLAVCFVCRSIVDIQSATAEIRRGKNKVKEERKKPQGKNIMACPVT